MKKEVSMRKAAIKDLDIAYNFQKQFVMHMLRTYKLHSIVDPHFKTKPLYDDIKKVLRSRKRFIFFLERNNSVIGFAELRIKKPKPWLKFKKEGEVGMLFISPKHSGKGYGSHLLNYSLKFLKKQGCDLATLGVHPKNPAQKLYSRFGFKQDFIQMYKEL